MRKALHFGWKRCYKFGSELPNSQFKERNIVNLYAVTVSSIQPALVLRFEGNSSVFMKKYMYIVTNDVVNNIPSISKTMCF